jgi:acetyl-CoA carboxylase carboxyl transferase subunit beta
MKDESRPALSASNGAHPDAPARPLPDNVAVKCPNCRELLLGKDWAKNLKVCQRCGHHFRLGARERIELLADPDSFEEFAHEIASADPLRFVSRSLAYPDYLKRYRVEAGVDEAVVVGRARIEELPLILVVMDSHFIGGSMGSVAGERITRAIEGALRERLPLLVVAASGGARMHEGMFALMQMAKTSAAVAKLSEAGIPYIGLLTDPTTGGVMASFASLADVILAEPGALIGFAGPRVIEQSMYQRLPKDVNTSEFVLAHGMLDGIVHRRALRPTMARLLRLYAGVASTSRS